jgi:hypothetical protein
MAETIFNTKLHGVYTEFHGEKQCNSVSTPCNSVVKSF